MTEQKDKVVSIEKSRRRRKIIKQPDMSVKSLSFGDITRDQDMSQGAWESEIKAFAEATTLAGLFHTEDWVFIVVDMLAELISQLPMEVAVEEIGADNKKTVEVVEGHAVVKILEQPNAKNDYATWMYKYVVQHVLQGNTIVWVTNMRKTLHIIPAQRVSLDFDDKARHVGYIVNDFIDFKNSQIEQVKLSLKEVWHQRRPNPDSEFWGMSPFTPNSKCVLFNRYTTDYMNSFYIKGATPGLALTMDKNISEDAAKRFLASFEQNNTGRRNMRRVMILPKGVSVDILSPSFSDQRILEAIDKNDEKILNTLKIPKHAVSMAKAGSLGSEEFKQSLKFMYQAAIIPTGDKIARFLTGMFREFGDLEENEFLRFNTDSVEVLKDDMLKKAELSEKLLAVFTPNEVRDRVWEAEPIDGGDELTSKQEPLQVQPNAAPRLPSPQPPPQQPEEEEAKAKAFDAEYVDYEQRSLENRKIKAIRTKYAGWLDLSTKQLDSAVEEKSEDIEDGVIEIFAEWAKAGIGIVLDSFKRVPAQKAEGDEVPSKLPPIKTLRRALNKEFKKSEDDYLDLVVAGLNATLDEGYDIQLAAVLDEENREAIIALKDRDEEKRLRTLSARGLDSFANVSENTTEQILAVVRRGLRDQIPTRDIGRTIAQKFVDISPSRAQTIARTEILTAVSLGKKAAMDNTAEVIPDLLKVWIESNDTRVRDSHKSIDDGGVGGETIAHDEKFSNGLEYPRDPKAKDPSEVINCRCDILMVPAEDLENLQP